MYRFTLRGINAYISEVNFKLRVHTRPLKVKVELQSMTKLQTWWSGTLCTSYKCNGKITAKWKFISKEFGLVISKVVYSGGSGSLSMVIHLKFYYTSWTHDSVVIIINRGALILWIDTGAFFWEGLLYYTLLVLPRQHGFWRSVIYDVIGWLFTLPHMRGIVVVVFIDRFIYLHFQTSIAADDRPNVASYVTKNNSVQFDIFVNLHGVWG